MKYRLLYTLLLICIPTLLFAQRQAVGHVVDESGQPVSYASVYFKKAPEHGTVTDNNGYFRLNVNEHDSLIISFIGYATKSLSSRAIKQDTLQIRLHQQPIMLEEAVVAGKTTRNKRKAMKDLLRFTRNRMNVDFPDENQKYRVHSTVSVKSGGNLLGFDEVIANIVELHGRGNDGWDSIQIKADVARRYIDANTAEKIPDVMDNHIGKQDKSNIQKIDAGSLMHKYLWGGNTKQMFDKLMEKPKNWSVTKENNDVTVLTYTETRNLLGIIKITAKVNYIIDAFNYSIRRISEEAVVSFNIPFGYKLNKDELSVMNLLSIAGEDIEHFRLKRGTINFKRNVIFTPSNYNSLRVKEKTMVFNMKAEEKAGQSIQMTCNAAAYVVSHEHNAKQYSSRALKIHPTLQTITIDEIK